MAPRWKKELDGTDRDAAAALIRLFESYGLGSLAPKIVDFIQEGYGADTITLLLQDTKEYQQRFRGNELRLKAGLPVLTPGEYLQVEAGYRQALQAAGLPEGFYDNPDDFHDFISKDIAPQEIAERATRASKLVNTIDPLQRRVIEERLGLSEGDFVAYYLDTDRALPILEQQIETTKLGAERQRAGFGFDQDTAENLYSQGVTVEEARQGYGAISEFLPTFDKLGEISGTDYTISDAESEVFGSDGDAATKRKRLASQERGRFSGSSGTSGTTLSREDTFSY